MNATPSPIAYVTRVDDLSEASLEGFFEGWPNPPSPGTLKELLKKSYAAVVAIDEAGEVVGFVNAISDGVMNAFIPLLEVRRDHRGCGIGRALVTTLLESLDGMYAIDLSCDEELVPFYERLGFTRGTAMLRRSR